MSAQELTSLQIKLVNIIQDKFRKPSSTEGLNILKTTPQVCSAVLAIWPEGEFEEEDIQHCLEYLNFDYIVPTKGGITWLITLNP